ncbi:MAG: hypothetical protein V3575_03665 [Candidatus Absconditabacteria bacterium]
MIIEHYIDVFAKWLLFIFVGSIFINVIVKLIFGEGVLLNICLIVLTGSFCVFLGVLMLGVIFSIGKAIIKDSN